ncbi:MAG: Sapep family Mn(2+)-dependent dipeptidase [Clostridiaceae bacterium]|jgi:succinyl-diaminopimelate desuccinylase|nr:Sapep family Mn(2+)-dependent dipeptidase [Clostridiaceae bacterium]
MKIFDELVNETLKMLAIYTVQEEASSGAPFGKGNAEALNAALKLAASFGFKTHNADGYVGWAEIGSGELFGVPGHLDTVPFGDGWTKNPYGEIADGKLYGRGAVDDKGPMLAALFAAKSLLDEGLKPKRRLRFIFGCNEETGWACMRRYAETEEMPALAFSPDADFPVINAEKGVINMEITLPLNGAEISVTAGERANVVPASCTAEVRGVKRVTTGVSAHGSRPQDGENAIVKMLAALATEDASLKLLYEKLNDCYGGDCNLALRDAQSGALTQNAGIIRSDARSVTVTLDIRYPVTFAEEEVLNRLKSAFPNAVLHKIHSHPPLYVPKDHFLIKALLAAYEKATGEKAAPIAIGGATYARAVPLGVAFGPELPGRKSTIHSPDEHISLEDFKTIFNIYREALKALIF